MGSRSRGAVRHGPLTHRSSPQRGTSPRYRARHRDGARHRYRARRTVRERDLPADLLPTSRLAGHRSERAILLGKAVSALAGLREPLRGRLRSTLLFEVALESCLVTALQRESYIATAALVISANTGIPICFERQRGAYRRAADAALAEVAETIALLRWTPQTSSPPTRWMLSRSSLYPPASVSVARAFISFSGPIGCSGAPS